MPPSEPPSGSESRTMRQAEARMRIVIVADQQGLRLAEVADALQNVRQHGSAVQLDQGLVAAHAPAAAAGVDGDGEGLHGRPVSNPRVSMRLPSP